MFGQHRQTNEQFDKGKKNKRQRYAVKAPALQRVAGTLLRTIRHLSRLTLIKRERIFHDYVVRLLLLRAVCRDHRLCGFHVDQRVDHTVQVRARFNELLIDEDRRRGP